MEKFSQTLVSKISSFQKRLQSILENDFEAPPDEANEHQSSQDLALIRGLSQALPEDHIDKAIVIFSRLALLFEHGALLENHDGKWQAQAYFTKGITQLFKNSEKLLIPVPRAQMMSVLKTSSPAMLKKLQLTHLDPKNKTSCLLIKVSPDFSFVLFSSLADIWLKDHIENVRKALINGFSD